MIAVLDHAADVCAVRQESVLCCASGRSGDEREGADRREQGSRARLIYFAVASHACHLEGRGSSVEQNATALLAIRRQSRLRALTAYSVVPINPAA